MSAAKPSLEDAIADINRKLTTARSIVSVTAQALDNGETDLELHSAEALGAAAETLDDLVSELCGLRLDAKEAGESQAPLT